MRAFIAAPVSPEIRKGLHSVMQRLRNTFRMAPIKWVTPDQFHLTFRFLGNVPDESAAEITSRLRAVCERFRPLDAFVSGLGCFPHASEPRVIWVGMNGGPGLLNLQRAIAETTAGFGDRPTHESFHPHLTVGRVRDISMGERREIGEALQRLHADNVGNWRIDRVVLLKSEASSAGSHYTTLAEIPLAAMEKPTAESSGDATSVRAL